MTVNKHLCNLNCEQVSLCHWYESENLVRRNTRIELVIFHPSQEALLWYLTLMFNCYGRYISPPFISKCIEFQRRHLFDGINRHRTNNFYLWASILHFCSHVNSHSVSICGVKFVPNRRQTENKLMELRHFVMSR